MSRTAQAVIDFQSLTHNLRQVKRLSPASKIMAIVKANAYGHGLLRIAQALDQTLDQVDAFGVATLEEALLLRQADIKQAITVLSGHQSAAELRLFCENNIASVVNNEMQLELLESADNGSALAVWLKLDTGMHRLGFAPEQFTAVLKRLDNCLCVDKPVGVMTHLANADDPADPFTAQQLEIFAATIKSYSGKDYPGPCSVANSAGIYAAPASHYECGSQWVRPGIMLYGASPLMGKTAEELGLRPVMTLRSSVIAVNRLRKGDTVGYRRAWQCPEDMPVAVIAIGYGDGYPRHARPGTPVLLNGQRVPLIGLVSMDMICVDLRTQPDAKIGDKVVLWGEGLPVEEVAECASTISYELLCGVTRRVEFIERAS